MSLTSNAVSVGVSTATAPAWWTAMTEKTWKQLATTADYDPVRQFPYPTNLASSGFTLVLGNYNGSTVDQVRGEQLFCANGGHMGYCGNEVYCFRVRTATPKWYRLTERTSIGYAGGPDALIDFSQPSGTQQIRVDNLDGLPRGMQSYDVQVFCKGYGKVIAVMTSSASSGTSFDGAGIWKFDRDRCGDNYSAFAAAAGQSGIPYATVAANAGDGPGYWEYGGNAWLGATGGNISGPISFWDAQNNEAVGMFAYPGGVQNPSESAWAINPTTGAIQRFNAAPTVGPSNAIFLSGSCTTTTPKVAAFMTRQSSVPYVWDLTNRATTRPTPKTVTNAAQWVPDYGSVAHWHPASNALLMYNQTVMGGQTSVQALRMNTPSDPLNSTWTWSTIAAAGGGQTPPGVGVSMYSKFNMIDDMGDGRSCLITTEYLNGVWVYKLPLTGI